MAVIFLLIAYCRFTLIRDDGEFAKLKKDSVVVMELSTDKQTSIWPISIVQIKIALAIVICKAA